MVRNDKTGRFESTKTIEEQIAEQEAKLAELKKEQAAILEEQKEAAKASRKEEAEVVKEAIKARLEQEAATRKAKRDAYKIYLEACDAADKLLVDAKKEETIKLNEFCKKYGSFHETITIGDTTYTCNYDTDRVSYVDPFKKLLDFWF